MTDSHAHLTFEQLAKDTDGFIKAFAASGGNNIVDTAYTLESCYEVLKIHDKYNGRYGVEIYSGLGIHPEEFIPASDFTNPITNFERMKKELDTVENLIKTNIDKVKVIGEIGLDYHLFTDDTEMTADQVAESKEIQKMAFRRQLEWAREFKLPLTIHTRDQFDKDDCIADALKIVAEVGDGKLTGSFHSYTGSDKYLDDMIGLGFAIGFNAIITYKSGENVRDLVRQVPLDRILLETDAPLLPTQSVRSNKKLSIRHGQPADVDEIAGYVAEIKGMKKSDVISKTDENFEIFFK